MTRRPRALRAVQNNTISETGKKKKGVVLNKTAKKHEQMNSRKGKNNRKKDQIYS